MDMSTNHLIVPGFGDEKDQQVQLRLQRLPDVPNALVCHVSGSVDTWNSTYFQRQMEKCIGAGFPFLIFDTQGLNYLSSTGIGAFTFLLKGVKLAHGNIVIVGIQPRVLEIFQLLGFSNFFLFADSIDDAKEKLFAPKKPVAPPPPPSIFPKTIQCPICLKSLRVPRAGRFRCSYCKSIIKILDSGSVSLERAV